MTTISELVEAALRSGTSTSDAANALVKRLNEAQVRPRNFGRKVDTDVNGLERR